MFPHRNIHNYTWTFLDGKTHNQIDQILIYRRWHSNILDVRSFKGVGCNTDHYLVVAKVRESLAINKEAAHHFDVKRFNLRKLNKLEVKKEYQLKISNSSAALENLNDSQDINRAWKKINENSKTSAKESLVLQELKQHKPWFDEECLGFLDQKKQVTMQ
jgi:hypothetical protein